MGGAGRVQPPLHGWATYHALDGSDDGVLDGGEGKAHGERQQQRERAQRQVEPRVVPHPVLGAEVRDRLADLIVCGQSGGEDKEESGLGVAEVEASVQEDHAVVVGCAMTVRSRGTGRAAASTHPVRRGLDRPVVAADVGKATEREVGLVQPCGGGRHRDALWGDTKERGTRRRSEGRGEPAVSSRICRHATVDEGLAGHDGHERRIWRRGSV